MASIAIKLGYHPDKGKFAKFNSFLVFQRIRNEEGEEFDDSRPITFGEFVSAFW
jgi:hypothetical protein